MPSKEQIAHHEASHAVLIARFGGAFGDIEIGAPRLASLSGDDHRILWGCVNQTVEVPADRRHLVVLAGVVGMLHLNFPWNPIAGPAASEVDALLRRIRARFTPQECGSDKAAYIKLTGLAEPSPEHAVETANHVAENWPAIHRLAAELVQTDLATMTADRAVAIIAEA